MLLIVCFCLRTSTFGRPGNTDKFTNYSFRKYLQRVFDNRIRYKFDSVDHGLLNIIVSTEYVISFILAETIIGHNFRILPKVFAYGKTHWTVI